MNKYLIFIIIFLTANICYAGTLTITATSGTEKDNLETVTDRGSTSSNILEVAGLGSSGTVSANTISGNSIISGNRIYAANLIGTSGTITGNTVSGNTINIAGAYTLPTKGGVTGQTVILQTNGTSLWQTPATGGSGTPGGNNTEVQFNDSASFGGDTNFVWDKNANRLTITGNTITTRITGSLGFPVQSARLLPINMPVGPLISVQDATWKLDFSADYSNTVSYQFRIPSTYSANPVLNLGYTVTANSGAFQIFASIAAITSGDSVVFNFNNFDTTNNSTVYTVPGTAGYLGEVNIPLTNNDAMTGNDGVILKINRNPTDTDDTLASALSLRYITLSWE